MKTVKAGDFARTPADVYRAADKEGMIKINHDRYPHRIFILQVKDRHTDIDNENLKDIDND